MSSIRSMGAGLQQRRGGVNAAIALAGRIDPGYMGLATFFYCSLSPSTGFSMLL
ncbi:MULTISPECIES: hypothetical protein [unclassified Paracoccus (in: a-proteobacteria)]|uniref:hypothetical protein n=1 Tax=unclassified Paracoccus (in: a-proteobacteria) TaxID=2688777 RepID=UPI001600F130|nr:MULTISPECIES: hypothetical protein [unclassified Paracoccus (in: a-proteobacteria)]MBB1490381.1 hypothetical protein [Paracoccus sp. MC1854]MBB1497223.1 hypothetical protein [Paracoccus sp. MC1862]QQO44803.1 hypothetical protein JGR78_16005 [Paracoccus sp. MC1862]